LIKIKCHEKDRFYYSALQKPDRTLPPQILTVGTGNVGSTASDIIMLSVWTEDWRKEGKLICLEHIAKVGMSEVSGSVISGDWMRTDIRQILGQMFKNGCFIK